MNNQIDENSFIATLKAICYDENYAKIPQRLFYYRWGLEDMSAPEDKIETILFLEQCCIEILLNAKEP